MKARSVQLTVFLFTLSLIAVPTLADSKHEFEPSVRVRYASLEEGVETGAAASVLLRARLESTWTSYVSTLIELDHVESFLKDKHSDGVRFNSEPEIPDVPGSDLNQAVLILGADEWRVHLGRQAINIGNERFVGSVGSWQNEQTFDAALLDGKLLSRSSLKYAYISKANRIFGRDAMAGGERPLARLGEHEHSTHLINLEFKEWDYWEFGAFGLLLDNDTIPALSSDTWGVRVGANYKPNHIQWRLESEIAAQKYETGYDGWIPYYRVKTGLEFKTHELSFNLESLDVKEGTPFRTTLATNHDFQGWADVFGVLPSTGLRDTFVKYTWRNSPWKLDLRWHYFSSLDDDKTFGQEVDADIIYKFNKNQNILLRIAHYEADTPSGPGANDRQRLILSYTLKL